MTLTRLNELPYDSDNIRIRTDYFKSGDLANADSLGAELFGQIGKEITAIAKDSSGTKYAEADFPCKTIWTSELVIGDKGKLVRLDYLDTPDGEDYIMRDAAYLDDLVLSVDELKTLSAKQLHKFIYEEILPEFIQEKAQLFHDLMGLRRIPDVTDQAATAKQLADVKAAMADKGPYALEKVINAIYRVEDMNAKQKDNLEWAVLHFDYLTGTLGFIATSDLLEPDLDGDAATAAATYASAFTPDEIKEITDAVTLPKDAAGADLDWRNVLPENPEDIKDIGDDVVGTFNDNPDALTLGYLGIRSLQQPITEPYGYAWNNPDLAAKHFNDILKAIAANDASRLPGNLKNRVKGVPQPVTSVRVNHNGNRWFLVDQAGKEIKFDTGAGKVRGEFNVVDGVPTGNDEPRSNIRRIDTYLHGLASGLGVQFESDGDGIVDAVDEAPAPADDDAAPVAAADAAAPVAVAAAAPTVTITETPRTPSEYIAKANAILAELTNDPLNANNANAPIASVKPNDSDADGIWDAAGKEITIAGKNDNRTFDAALFYGYVSGLLDAQKNGTPAYVSGEALIAALPLKSGNNSIESRWINLPVNVTTVTPADEAYIKQLAEYAAKNPTVKVTIIGAADRNKSGTVSSKNAGYAKVRKEKGVELFTQYAPSFPTAQIEAQENASTPNGTRGIQFIIEVSKETTQADVGIITTKVVPDLRAYKANATDATASKVIADLNQISDINRLSVAKNIKIAMGAANTPADDKLLVQLNTMITTLSAVGIIDEATGSGAPVQVGAVTPPATGTTRPPAGTATVKFDQGIDPTIKAPQNTTKAEWYYNGRKLKTLQPVILPPDQVLIKGFPTSALGADPGEKLEVKLTLNDGTEKWLYLEIQ